MEYPEENSLVEVEYIHPDKYFNQYEEATYKNGHFWVSEYMFISDNYIVGWQYV